MAQEQLAAFYRDASVGLITPLRDGMNLVAKVVTCGQMVNNPSLGVCGVSGGERPWRPHPLTLRWGRGAHAGGTAGLSSPDSLGAVINSPPQVNPYETENVADTLNWALEMPLDQRQMRMFQLKTREKRMDVDSWVQGFLGAMGAIYTNQERSLTREQAISKIGEGEFDRNLGPLIDRCARLGVILDFDGTLSPLAMKPELAIIPPDTKRVLERLSHYSDCKITVISGRNISDLQRKVGRSVWNYL